MLASNIRIVQENGFCELHARVQCDTHWVWGDESFELWYRFPEAYKPFLSGNNGDPFVAALLPPAMVLGEPLDIQAGVSAKLLRALPEIQTILRSWNSDLHEVTVNVPEHHSPAQIHTQDQAKGLFFSLGVDSSYSLLKNHRPGPESTTPITHLITVEGFDVYLWERQRFIPMLANIRKVAAAFGLDVLPVTTNLRDFSDRIVSWDNLYHGAALASIGLALGNCFGQILIAASQTYSWLRPLGTHPLLDPLWSSETLNFVHDGLEATRLDKIYSITQSEEIIQRLRVCTSDDVTDDYNCGLCAKCTSTMIGLHLANTLSICRTLPDRIDLDAVRKLRVTGPVTRSYYQEYVDALGTSQQDRVLKEILQECLARYSPY